MAQAAGVYMHLWRPEEIGINYARDLIDPLAAAVARLATSKRFFEEFNPTNGWGKYETLLMFCVEYLQACKDHPDAAINTCR
jgi:hypothetical protein